MTIRFFRQTISLLASADDTNGVLGALEVAGPKGFAPPLHVHHREDEAFYVLEGEYSVFVGDAVIPTPAGTWVWGPRDVPHGYRVRSDHGRHLSLVTPGGFEGFSRRSRRSRHRTPTPGAGTAEIAAVAARYGVDLLGPAPAPG